MLIIKLNMLNKIDLLSNLPIKAYHNKEHTITATTGGHIQEYGNKCGSIRNFAKVIDFNSRLQQLFTILYLPTNIEFHINFMQTFRNA